MKIKLVIIVITIQMLINLTATTTTTTIMQKNVVPNDMPRWNWNIKPCDPQSAH